MKLIIRYGNQTDSLRSPGQTAYDPAAFEAIRRDLNAEHLVQLNQVHGVAITCVDDLDTPLPPVTLSQHEGDALSTSTPKVALSVVTADCLPIVLHDPTHNAISVIHAGWRGSVAGVLAKTVQHMSKRFGSQPHELEAHFGPSAGVCCYEVGPEFAQNLGNQALVTETIIQRDGTFYFDCAGYNTRELIRAGLDSEAIDRTKNCCTLCTPGYHSSRRTNRSNGRQATVAVLR